MEAGASTGREILQLRSNELLAAAGTNRVRLLKAEILLVNISDFDAMNEVWEAWISPWETCARRR